MWHRLFSINRPINMKTRLYFLVTASILLSTVAVSVFSFTSYTNELHRRVSSDNQQLLNQTAANLNSYFDDLARLSLVPAYNADFIQALEQSRTPGQSASEQLQQRRFIETFLDEMMVYPRQDILHAFVIADQIYYGSRRRPSINIDADPAELFWWDKLSSVRTPFFLGPHVDELILRDDTVVFSVINMIRSLDQAQTPLAVIKINADFSVIDNICKNIDLGLGSGVLLVDGEGREVFSSAPLEAEAMPEMEPDSSGIRVDGYLVNAETLTLPDWKLYSVVSLYDIESGARQVRNIALLIAVLAAAVTLLSVLMMLRMMLSPLYEIIDKVERIGNGDFAVHFPGERRDEVGLLGRSMNEVAERLEHTISENTRLANEVIHSQLVEKQAQVSMLYSQIQPHFIYNTLNMINMMVEMGDSEHATENIQRLAALMRGMSKSDTVHPLRKEALLLEDYLAIQACRYKGRLQYTVWLQPGTEDIMVPTMLLQPVVENAVIHSCEAQSARTQITVEIQKESDVLHAVVKDNGVGMSREQLCKVRNRLLLSDEEMMEQEHVGEGGSGLRNVYRRLKIRFDARADMQLESTPGGGTCVSITIKLPEDPE